MQQMNIGDPSLMPGIRQMEPHGGEFSKPPIVSFTQPGIPIGNQVPNP